MNDVNKVLAISLETNGFNRGSWNKARDYNILSLAAIVADADRFEPISDYVALVNNTDNWDKYLEDNVHGLKKSILQKYGQSEEDFAFEFFEFLVENFSSEPIVMLGYNLDTFARFFIDDLLNKYKVELILSSRSLDSFTIAKTFYGFDTQKQLLKYYYGDKEKFNSLDKVKANLRLFRDIKNKWNTNEKE